MATVSMRRFSEMERPPSSPCDGVFMEGVASVKGLLNVSEELKRANPGAQILVTLDDLNQAEYTSMHSVLTHDLDGEDEAGAHDFSKRHACFMAKAGTPASAKVAGALSPLEDEWGADLFSLNENPDLALDRQLCAFIAPVGRACEALSAFPNGYFAGDLDPFEIFAIAEMLEQEHGYELFGVGASYVGLARAAPPDALALDAFLDRLRFLFSPALDAAQLARLKASLTGKRTFLFSYSGGM